MCRTYVVSTQRGRNEEEGIIRNKNSCGLPQREEEEALALRAPKNPRRRFHHKRIRRGREKQEGDCHLDLWCNKCSSSTDLAYELS